MINGSLQKIALRLLLGMTSILPLFEAQAYEVIGPREISLFASPVRHIVGRGTEENAVTVSDFKTPDLRKFFMVSFGPEIMSQDYTVASSFTGDFFDDGCRITNPPEGFVEPSFERKLANFGRQTTISRKCVSIQVRDLGVRPLKLPQRQPNCTVTRLDANTALMNGGFCFFGINPESRFEVSYLTNPSCANEKTDGIPDLFSGDIFNFSGFYIAGDASGQSIDLVPIDSVRVRYAQEATGEGFPLAPNSGLEQTRWPARLSLDVHMGKLKTYNQRNGSDVSQMLDASLLTGNTCSQVCRWGSCESVCDFSGAAAAEMRLLQVDTTLRVKPRLLDQWYIGAVAPAQWAGFIPVVRALPYAFLQAGKRYRIEASLNYPTAYYGLAKDGFQQILIGLRDFARSSISQGSVTLPILVPLSGLDPNSMRLPAVPMLPVLAGGMMTRTDFSAPLTALSRSIMTVDWPPYYIEQCNQDASKCQNPNSGKMDLTLFIEFDVLEVPERGEIVIGNITRSRRSNVLSSYEQRAVEQLPETVCE